MEDDGAPSPRSDTQAADGHGYRILSFAAGEEAEPALVGRLGTAAARPVRRQFLRTTAAQLATPIWAIEFSDAIGRSDTDLGGIVELVSGHRALWPRSGGLRLSRWGSGRHCVVLTHRILRVLSGRYL